MFHPPLLPPVPRLTGDDPRCCPCRCHCAAAGEQGEIRQRLHADGEGPGIELGEKEEEQVCYALGTALAVQHLAR